MTDWFRSWHGAPTDPKWRTIARRAGCRPGDVASVVWVLLDRASQAAKRGSIKGYDAEVIADALGYETEQIEAIIAALHEKAVLIDCEFASWTKHQPMREDGSAERAKAFRERKKAEQNGDEPAPNATERTRTQTTSREDTDTDTDTDTEKKEEKIKGTCASARAPRALLRAEFSTVLSDEMADAVIEHRQRMRRALTPKAAALLAKQFGKCPDPNAAAAMMLERGWQGFNAEWMTREKTNGQGHQKAHQDEWREFVDVFKRRRPIRREEGALEGDFSVVDDGGIGVRGRG